MQDGVYACVRASVRVHLAVPVLHAPPSWLPPRTCCPLLLLPSPLPLGPDERRCVSMALNVLYYTLSSCVSLLFIFFTVK